MMFATLAGKEQVPDAILLADTIKKHHPDARTVLCLVDCHVPAGQVKRFDEVLLVSNQGYPEADPAYNGPTKAYLMQVLLNRYPDDLVYLDPETIVYGSFDEIFELLQHHPVIAAPYNLEPYHSDQDSQEIRRLNQGFIHSGFLALHNSERARKFLQWWSNKMNKSTLGPAKIGGAHHLWLSLGIVPFGIHLLKEPGYQYAAWNWHEPIRTLTNPGGNKICLDNGKRLRSMVTAGAREMLQNPSVPISDPIQAAVAELLGAWQTDLDRIRQSLP